MDKGNFGTHVTWAVFFCRRSRDYIGWRETRFVVLFDLDNVLEAPISARRNHHCDDRFSLAKLDFSENVQRGKLTKRPIMTFRPIRQAYRQPLLAWFHKPLFKTLCLIGWRQETPFLPRSFCGPKVSKSSISSQTSWTTSTSSGSASTYRTWRTFSVLHLYSSVQPSSPGRSARKPSVFPAGSPSKV